MEYGTARIDADGDQDQPPRPLMSQAQAPLFSAGVDDALGLVRLRGHLDREGAEDLLPTLDWLRRQGHRRITVLVSPLATAEPDARDLLDGAARRFAAERVRLLIR